MNFANRKESIWKCLLLQLCPAAKPLAAEQGKGKDCKATRLSLGALRTKLVSIFILFMNICILRIPFGTLRTFP